ncbi:MAG: DeoR/GlpR family DNA-binding transcription regulator [Candidatus Excrementavichristensenella sp.]|jgi:DeoR/GlpR family transcriptional regulator of sugar metabolism
MYEYNRLQGIMDMLEACKSSSIHDLAQKFYVSETTIRRDLNELEKQGKVRRVFGGVLLMERDLVTTPFYGHTTIDKDKQEIAQIASQYIQNGNTIMLDASSTTLALVPYLKRFKRLTIITNSAVSVASLQDLDADVFVTGGYMMHNSQGYTGNYAEEMLRNFNADILFFSASGLSMEGKITNQSYEAIAMIRVMLTQSRKKYFMCDSSKFDRENTYTVCWLNDIDGVITNKPFTGHIPQRCQMIYQAI